MIDEVIFAPTNKIHGSSIVTLKMCGKKEMLETCFLEIFESSIFKQKHAMAKFAKMKINGKFLDEVVYTVFFAPKSFCGLDTVEISMHASSYILKTLLEYLSGIDGFRMARRGEFSYLAFLNGKINLVEAESIASLVLSNTEEEHKIALMGLSGRSTKKIDILRNSAIEVLSTIETMIDFSDEVHSVQIDAVFKCIENLKDQIGEHIKMTKNGIKVFEGVKIVLCGKPNVGKSSVFNFFAGKNKAIVSDIAGTTRDILDYDVEIAGVKVTFFDTAGIRVSDCVIEKEGIKRTYDALLNADIVLHIMDLSQDLICESYNFGNAKILKVFNKTDVTLNNLFLNDLQNGGKDKNTFYTSCKTLDGLDNLFTNIENIISQEFSYRSYDNVVCFNARHLKLLSDAFEILSNCRYDLGVEILAEDLRAVLTKISEILGYISPDDVLGAIFSKFCIGK